MNLVSQTLELNVNCVLFAILTARHSRLVAELAHEDELLEETEIRVPSATARARIVHQVGEQIVIVELFDLLEDAEGMLSKSESLIEKPALCTGCLLFRQLFEHVNGDFVQVEIFFVLFVQRSLFRVVRFGPTLHLVLPCGDHFEECFIPFGGRHLFKEAVVNATQDELLATLADFLGVHVLLKELVIVSHCIHVLAEVAEEIVQEKVESLKEVAMVANVVDHFGIGHSFLDQFTIAVLQELVDLKHIGRFILHARWDLLNRVLDELHLAKLFIYLYVLHEIFCSHLLLI